LFLFFLSHTSSPSISFRLTYQTTNQLLSLTFPTMSADTQTQPLSLSKVDSAIDDTPASPTESKIKHRRTSSTVSGVFNINDLGE
jgi:hypothetical protein